MQTQKAVNLHNFRVVLRGTTPKGARVRIVATTPAANEGAAAELAQANPKVKAAVSQLADLYINVFSPLVAVK